MSPSATVISRVTCVHVTAPYKTFKRPARGCWSVLLIMYLLYIKSLLQQRQVETPYVLVEMHYTSVEMHQDVVQQTALSL